MLDFLVTLLGFWIALILFAYIIGFIITSFVLWLVSRMMKLNPSDLKTALIINLVSSGAGFLFGIIGNYVSFIKLFSPLVNLIILTYLIKINYNKDGKEIGWGKAILIWFIAFLISIPIFLVIMLLLALLGLMKLASLLGPLAG